MHDYFYRSSELNQSQIDIDELEREETTTTELVWTHIGDLFKLDLTLYQNEIDKLVQYNPIDDHYFNGEGVISVGIGNFGLKIKDRLIFYQFQLLLPITNNHSSKSIGIFIFKIRNLLLPALRQDKLCDDRRMI